MRVRQRDMNRQKEANPETFKREVTCPREGCLGKPTRSNDGKLTNKTAGGTGTSIRTEASVA